MDEHLLRLNLKNGKHIDFKRDDENTVKICSEDMCVELKNATGKTTTDLFALLEPFGELAEEEGETDGN